VFTRHIVEAGTHRIVSVQSNRLRKQCSAEPQKIVMAAEQLYRRRYAGLRHAHSSLSPAEAIIAFDA